MIWLGVIFFVFIHLRLVKFFGSMEIELLLNLEKFQLLFLQNVFFSSLPLFSFSDSNYTYIKLSLRFCSFFLKSLCTLVFIVSIASFSTLLLHNRMDYRSIQETFFQILCSLFLEVLVVSSKSFSTFIITLSKSLFANSVISYGFVLLTDFPSGIHFQVYFTGCQSL